MSAKKLMLAQYDLHNVLFNNALDQVTDSEAGNSLMKPMNNFKWIAGHLLSCQTHLARIGGTDVQIPWVEHFPLGPGAPQAADDSAGKLPSITEIKAKWNEVHAPIRKGLENLPDEALEQKVDVPHPIQPFDDTLGGLWAFVNHHQAYTIGQLGVLRRGHNKAAMSYSAAN